jgi:WD40-like Beta Propeller Repeat
VVRLKAVGTFVVVCLATSLAVAVPAAATTLPVRDALVVDVLKNVAYVPYTSNTIYDSTGSHVPVAGPSSVPGGVRVARPSSATPGPGIEVLAADGGSLEVGTYTSLNGQWTSGSRPLPVVRLVTAAIDCAAFVASNPGQLVVQAVTHDLNGVITSFAASYQLSCTLTGAVATGQLRYQSDLGYASAGSTVTRLGAVVAGSHTPFTATIRNDGTDPLTLGTPTPVDRGTSAPSLVMGSAGEDCSSAPLAPAATCTLNLEYVDNGVAGPVAELRLSAPALARGYVTALALATSVVSPPDAPVRVVGDEAFDGVRLRWDFNAVNPPPDGWKVRRVDGPSAVLVATLPSFPQEWSDTSLTKGESATYTVTAYNIAGEATSAPVTLTRPDLPDPPAAVDRSTLVVDELAASSTVDTATGGTVLVSSSPPYPTLLHVWASGRSIEFPRLLGPGTFTVGDLPGQMHVTANGANTGCDTTGTIDVHEAWIRADMSVHRLDADFHLMCAGIFPIEAQLRLGTGTAFVSVTSLPQQLTDFSATTGQTPDRRTVQLRNTGTEPVAVGQPAISGPDAAAFHVTDDTCPGSLDPAAACTLQVDFAPTRSLSHSASLTFDLGTTIGSRTVPLAGTAIGPPPLNAPEAVGVLGRILVRWSGGGDGGSPITGYHVLRAGATGPFNVVQDLPATTLSWTDTAVTPGETYRYQLVTDNQYGSDTPTANTTATVLVPHEELLAAVRPYQRVDIESLPVHGGLPVPLGTGLDTDEPAVSPDGRQLAYVAYDAAGNAGLWLRALDGSAAPRQLVDAAEADELDPSWSPDGSSVTYSRFTALDGAVWSISTVPGATAQAFPGGASAMQPSWLPDGSGLVVTDLTAAAPRLARISISGTRTLLSGAAGGSAPAVSPRGDRVAFVWRDANDVDHLSTVPVAGGTETELASDFFDVYNRPVWAPDGQAVVVGDFNANGSSQVTLWQAPSGALPASVQKLRSAAGFDIFALSWRRQDVAAPAITFPAAPARTSGSVSLPVSVTDDTMPVGGLGVTCTVDGVPVGRCAGGWAGTLRTGSHTLAVTAGDAHGHSSSASYTWTVDATAPTVSTAALPSFLLTSPLTFSYAAADASGVATYDVRYRRAGWADAAFSAFASPAGWTGTTARTRTLAVAPGYEYCLSVRARDVIGNVSAWSAERCTAMPLDDRALARASSGWTSAASSSAYRGTLTRSVRTGTRLTRSGVRVRRMAVVATTCPTCGSVDVFIGSTRLGTLRLTSAATRTRQMLLLPLRPSITAGTITLRTLSGRVVLVDGLGLRRT